MDNIKQFFKMFSIGEIIEIVLISLVTFMILDMFNIPTFIIERYGIIGKILPIIIIAFFIVNKRILSLLKVNVCNYVDLIIISLLVSITLFLAFTKFMYYSEFKIKVSILLQVIIVICFIIRIINLYRPTKKQCENKDITNIYDIKQLYENNIDNSNNNLIFLEEKDVSYDLLNREKIILDLFNSVNLCRNKEKFIISLTGKWGSGKTTILNIVKEKLDKDKFIIVDEFDIWKYNNEKSLIYGILDEILKKLEINFSTSEMKKVVNSCIAMLSNKTDINIEFLISDKKVLDKIKMTINNYLNKNDKRVVFVFDNFERTNENNVLNTLKTISTILNIDRFIYVLSYDEEEMQEIFKEKLKINYDYMEKIIQLPLSVPDINQKDIDLICTRCMENLLKHYGVSDEEIKNYIPAIDMFNKNIKDLRSFKRKINSICNSCFYGENYLNRIDNFLIELIKQENIELYRGIEENYDFYVSYDQMAIYGYPKYTAKSFNENATKYFDNLFNNKENQKYKEILSLLFPNVEKYFNTYRSSGKNIEFWNESNIIIQTDNEQYHKSIRDKRIYNAKFFNLYFTMQKNGFIDIDKKINDFIKWNNNNEYNSIYKGTIEIGKELNKVLFLYTGFEQKYIIETLEIYAENIEKNRLQVLMNLICSQEYMDDSMIFMGLNARRRLQIVCAEIIKKLSKEEIEQVKEFIEVDYKDMYFIKGILYWLKPKNNYNLDSNEEIFYSINKSYEKLINNIVEKNINIYDKKIYSKYNIYCLMNDERYKSQIKYINEETIFMFLADMISNSIGSKYGYSINLDEFNKMTSFEIVDSIIAKKNIEELNELEIFIKEVYERAKESDAGKRIDERVVYRNEYIDVGKINYRKEGNNTNE